MRTLILLLVGSSLLFVGCRTRIYLPKENTRDSIYEANEAEIQEYPWPDHVTGEEKNQIENALRTIFDVGGRDGRDAERLLVAMDGASDAVHFRAVGRIVTEMKNAIDQYGLDNYEGKSRIMVLDRILRKLDGLQARLFGEEYGLDIDDPASKAERIVRRWNWWYRKGRFITRYRPWDPRVDMVDPEEEGEGGDAPPR